MKLLKSILVAVDFTESSENILENSINFAKTFKSKITLIHILPDDINNEKVSLLVEKAVTTKLKEANDRIANEGLETGSPILEYGNYCDKIVSASEKIIANLVIVGSGNKSSDEAFQLGSTAEKIVKKSNKPVFVIKNGRALNIKNIICPVDFSRESSRALNSAIIISRMVDAKLVILSVYSHFKHSFAKLDATPINELRHLEHEKEFRSFLEGFNLIDLNFEKEIVGGEPSEEILKYIKKNKSDLLIMGATGRSGISKILMGSVTEKVIREVPCSFITLKNEDVVALEIESKIQDIENHYMLAQKLFENGFFEESIQQYKICLNINFMHIPSLRGIAEVYEKIGDIDNSKKHKEMAERVLERMENMKIEKEVREQRKH
ncbi:universal stress protein [Xanthomarina sp.]|uniref:universal stress protein n=1 Tax=Xanthomarina sp. TaxID=1931211 RepID=UPI002CE1B9A6|nr:universal stress protein [Xanthomarina sp.]HLV39946.1 universal stress protein [Xanthomarina sp.]